MRTAPFVSTALAAALLALAQSSLQAAPVSINRAFMNLENRNINSLGFAAGKTLRIGADSVTPNGAAGTTGVGTTTDLVTGLTVTRTITFSPSPVVPNLFARNLTATPELLGPWSLKFSNGEDSATANVSLPAGTDFVPFISSVTLSGTSARPTFSWAPPADTVVNGYRINIFDKALINLDPAKGPISAGQVTSRNLQPGQTNYTVDGADFTVPGYAFTLGKNYSIEISVIQTKDRTSTNLSNTNLASISRSYADFTAREGEGPAVNLPVVLQNGDFKFDMAVRSGETYYIDPVLAVGYDYLTGAGDPNFKSVVLPTGIGDNLYDVYTFDAAGNLVLVADDLAGGVNFDFGALGVNAFRVLGIETSANIDPLNTTAFITGLSFTNSGRFSGVQRAITVDVTNVPEPGSLALVTLALFAGAAVRRRA
jgi:PEP-CTERM motif